MPFQRIMIIAQTLICLSLVTPSQCNPELPIHVGEFLQQVHRPQAEAPSEFEFSKPLPWYPSLEPLVGSREKVRDVAKSGNEIAVAAESGLYLGDGEHWKLAMPVDGDTRWAPIDVRAVAYDGEGKLW
ncbi:MAG: hypothetical protein KC964_05715, partial [Candidatus Omnitrophica bacterium]|nr:hypothetical protein [Candidatus Omnitrophota bacterium]